MSPPHSSIYTHTRATPHPIHNYPHSPPPPSPLPRLHLPWQPDLQVIAQLRREPDVPSAKQHLAVGKLEPAQALLGVGDEGVVLGVGLLGSGDLD
jgi:hypothetical protein